MFDSEVFRQFALLAVGVLAVGKLFIVRRVQAGRHVPLSRHAAADRLAFLVFVACLSLAAVLFHFYSSLWLVPTAGLGPEFSLVMALALICVVVAAWVADRGTWSRRIHQTAAYGIFIAMPIMVLLMLAAPNLSLAVRLIATVALLALLLAGYRLFFERRQSKDFLVYQVAYFNIFFAVLVAAAYL